jgi:hypothetical protein
MQITKIRFGVWQPRTRGCYRANKAVLALANPFHIAAFSVREAIRQAP